MARKTVNVEEMKNWANARLAESTGLNNEGRQYRQGVMAMIEEILHASGNYKGFSYLTVHEVPKGYRPGINLSGDDGFLEDYDERFEDTDNTRVYYF